MEGARLYLVDGRCGELQNVRYTVLVSVPFPLPTGWKVCAVDIGGACSVFRKCDTLNN